MPQKKHKPEENEPSCAMGSSAMANAKLRRVDVLVSQGRSVSEAVRSIGVTQFTYFRWRKEFGGQCPGWWFRRPRAEPPA